LELDPAGRARRGGDHSRQPGAGSDAARAPAPGRGRGRHDHGGRRPARLVLRRYRRGTAAAPVPDDAAGVDADAGRAPSPVGTAVLARDRGCRHRLRRWPPSSGGEALGPVFDRDRAHRAAQRDRRPGVRMAVLEARDRDGDARPLQRRHRAARDRAAGIDGAAMNDADASWQLQPASIRARLLMIALCTVPLLVGVIVVGERWKVAVPAVIGVSLLAVLLDVLMRRHRVLVDASGLEVVTAVYRRKLAWPELDLEAARVFSLDEYPARKPMFKTNGMSMPGFHGGSFRSRGLDKLFVATVGGKRLLWLPTTRGYTLLLEPRRPQALLERLRELAPPAPRR